MKEAFLTVLEAAKSRIVVPADESLGSLEFHEGSFNAVCSRGAEHRLLTYRRSSRERTCSCKPFLIEALMQLEGQSPHNPNASS